jgi:glycosyltransferase involved in cell wall biosynthesis
VRLLLVIAELRHGGAERIVVELAADACRRGDVVMVASGGGPWVQRVLEAGADHAVVPLQRRAALATLAGAGRLAAVIRGFQPDVVHAHNLRAALAAVLALSRRGGRRSALLSTVHGLAPDDYRAAAWLLRLAGGGTVVACAPAVGRALLDAGFPAGRLDVVTNGVAVQAPSEPELEAARRRFGTGSRPLVVGIGRLVDQKAWPTLIEAARHIHDADVLVAGDGPLRGRLEAAAAEAGGRVRFVGVVEEPAALLRLARCVVSTSRWEGLPLALLEALTLGAPVVATQVGGIADLIPPDAALLVQPGDPVATAGAVNRVLTEPDLAERLSCAARAASHAWSLDAMLAGYRQRYGACVSDRM